MCIRDRSISQCSSRYPLSNKLLSTSYEQILVKFSLLWTIFSVKKRFWGQNFRYISNPYKISISTCSGRYSLSNTLLCTKYKQILVNFLLFWTIFSGYERGFGVITSAIFRISTKYLYLSVALGILYQTSY